MLLCFFFFKQKTAYEMRISDWSSDVCSSDLRDEHIKVVALALDNGVEAMLWDLAALFEGLSCVILPGFFSPAQRLHCLEQSQEIGRASCRERVCQYV